MQVSFFSPRLPREFGTLKCGVALLLHVRHSPYIELTTENPVVGTENARYKTEGHEEPNLHR